MCQKTENKQKWTQKNDPCDILKINNNEKLMKS